MDKLYIIIPAYNEHENICNIIDSWYPIVLKYGEESRLVIIDDGSKDNTLSLLEEYSIERPQLIVLTKQNSGHGPTILYGYQYALSQGTDYIFQTDSDGQTIPEEFEQFWKKRNEFDLIIGHRMKRQDGISRIFITKILKLFIKIYFRTSVADANTPFRLMKSSTLSKFIDLVPSDYFLSNVLITILFVKRKCLVKYIPITFRPRQGGENKINIKRIFLIGIQAIRDFREINRRISNTQA